MARHPANIMATARGRIGYLIDPRILAYATAGVGFVSWSAEGGITGCPGCTIKLDGTDSGFVFGLGVEGKISETMTARIEFPAAISNPMSSGLP
jgi:opacity protein-like surface antigen